ncbi:UDP-glucose 4-epimerase GalE [Pseudoduganella sp. FT25W]|jgi:UDP-glucose 4-epimerase|uniref:UDP-glucose 4-epimerase n=1 Tax=Duganella alba TaxID=2666081 RepID=A0A6L5QK95_9BURK|nr:UDP-glucose 4-epimerase GalE [Duganella alba]MRX10100.1 UDP-glucose 4-epimerase GalE [Duganella alba]MRX16712.1 UDP-glucose 4-epimerase GalE [Duganella alba]
MQAHILVVGGAGYVGSHMVKRLRHARYQPVVLDNLSQGRRAAVAGVPLVVADLHDETALDVLFQAFPIQAVMHFASFIQVGESVRDPSRYYENNVGNTLGLLKQMARHKVRHFIFSSTAAIFGNPEYVPIDEQHPRAPINPYGKSKLMVEEMLDDFAQAYRLHSCCLRYFNAAGADPEAELGECHEPETHLIPLVLQAAGGRRPSVTIYGDDYATPDGTCIRDYIHVQDLCDAHLLALRKLEAEGGSLRYNLGNGNGYSIREVIAAAERVTGRQIAQLKGPRRDGDPPRLVADAARARNELGWRPRFADLDTIIRHAWAWEQRRPHWELAF